MTAAESLAGIIEYEFGEQALAIEALTHTSYANENRVPHNERLEFLGDSVLNLVTTRLLYSAFPAHDEGQLSRLRSRLVNTETLAEIAAENGVDHIIRLGIGEQNSGGRGKPSILADATEAIVGAVFLDGGFAAAEIIVTRWMTPRVVALTKDQGAVQRSWRDPRSLLQEYVQGKHKTTPTFDVVSRQGPAHEPTFTVEVRLGTETIGRGEGRSKRDATHAAAHDAMQRISVAEE